MFYDLWRTWQITEWIAKVFGTRRPNHGCWECYFFMGRERFLLRTKNIKD